MNATKQGLNAGKATRRTINAATNTTVEASKTVATAVGGFFKGLLSDPDAPVKRTRKPAAKPAVRRTTVKK